MHLNPVAEVTRNHTSRLFHSREGKIELSNASKQFQTVTSFTKEGDPPPWYKPLVSMAVSTSISVINKLLRQEVQASSPTSKELQSMQLHKT